MGAPLAPCRQGKSTTLRQAQGTMPQAKSTGLRRAVWDSLLPTKPSLGEDTGIVKRSKGEALQSCE